MPPSERNVPAAADEPDDIVEKAPSHPVTTTLLIVSSVALIMAIGLTLTELGRYVNKGTREQLDQYKITAVQYYQRMPESGESGGEGEVPASVPQGRRKRAPVEEQPVEQPKETTPPPASDPTPPAGDPSPAPEGGSGN